MIGELIASERHRPVADLDAGSGTKCYTFSVVDGVVQTGGTVDEEHILVILFVPNLCMIGDESPKCEISVRPDPMRVTSPTSSYSRAAPPRQSSPTMNTNRGRPAPGAAWVVVTETGVSSAGSGVDLLMACLP